MFIEGNQIHNFMSSSGSGTVINYGTGSGSDFLTRYGSGSGSTSQKVTVPTVPVPVPQHCLLLRLGIVFFSYPPVRFIVHYIRTSKYYRSIPFWYRYPGSGTEVSIVLMRSKPWKAFL
jgi:hypothetical protein